MTNGNDFISPIVLGNELPSGEQNNRLTKREYFAGLALQGLLSNPNPGDIPALCDMAVQSADVLINYLNKSDN